MKNLPPILDMTCGGRMMWVNKHDPRILAFDCRKEKHTLCDGRAFEVAPDVVGDFRHLPFPDAAFYQINFDPPHLISVGEEAWMKKKYGKLERKQWRDDVRAAFAEAWRVLRPGGTIIFKWSSIQIPLAEVKKLFPDVPVFKTGHKDEEDKRKSTYIISFFKMP